MDWNYVLTGVGTLLAGAAGWGLKTWKGYSSASAQVSEDNARSTWYSDLHLRVKDSEAAQDALQAANIALLKQQMEDAKIISRQEVTLEYLRERSTKCEEDAVKSAIRLNEQEERNRALSEQILLAHHRLRKLFSVVSQLNAIEAARFVKENLDENIHDVVAHIKEQDVLKGSGNGAIDVKPKEGK